MDDKTGFETSEHRNAFVSPNPSAGRRTEDERFLHFGTVILAYEGLELAFDCILLDSQLKSSL
jgi:hypothetical protein